MISQALAWHTERLVSNRIICVNTCAARHMAARKLHEYCQYFAAIPALFDCCESEEALLVKLEKPSSNLKKLGFAHAF